MKIMRPLAVPGLLLIAPIGIAGEAMIPDLQPRHYASASGEYVLWVDPSRRSGGGGANYELRHGGIVVWSRRHEFTFWEAVVADDGAVGGYGYSRGYGGWGGDHGDFFVAILDPAGAVHLRETAPRQDTRTFHTMADPKGYGLFFNADSDRMVVRASKAGSNRGREFWSVYSLAEGALVGEFPDVVLMADSTPTILDAHPVAGTPLTLIYGYGSGAVRSDSGDAACLGPSRTGPMFVLLDSSFTPIWNLAFDDDKSGADERRQRIQEEIRRSGAILASGQPGQFELRDAVSGERVTYAVAADAAQPDGWKISRVAVAPYGEAADQGAPWTLTIPAVELEKLGRIELDRGEAGTYDGPIRGIYDFAIDDRGRFGFVEVSCEQGSREALLVIVDDQGDLAAKVVIDAKVPDARCHLPARVAWLGDDDWLVLLSDSSGFNAHRIEIAKARSTLLATIPSFAAKALAPMLDGGFVVLANSHSRYTSKHVVSAFDADGTLRWTVDSDYGEDTRPFSPHDVAVTTSGDVVVLDGIVNKLRIYGADGVHRTNIDLETAWTRKPRYPTGLTADGIGAVIVNDSSGNPPIVRMTLDGKVTAEFAPRYADGRRFEMWADIQSGPDGRLWSSIGDALLRMDDDGVVEHVLGRAPSIASLGAWAAITVASNGLIYVADEKTAAVHAFDRDGRRKLVAEPATSDYDEDLFAPTLTVSDDGEIFVTHSETTLVQYTASGERVGLVSVELDEVSQKWYSQPGSRNRWILGYEDVYLVDAGGNVLRRIQRAANGRWLHDPGPAGVAPDGSIAIMSDAIVLHYGHAEPPSVTLYSAAGDALTTWPVPPGVLAWADFAFDGAHLAFRAGSDDDPDSAFVIVTDAEGKPLFQVLPPSGESIDAVFLVPTEGASELWLFDGEYGIDRYAMP